MNVIGQSHVEQGSAFRGLMERVGGKWNAIIEAGERAVEKRRQFAEVISAGEPRFWSEDWSAVVFGSMARDEYTQGSDADWTLLVDAPVDPAHVRATQAVLGRTKEGEFKPPGRTGVFGNITFSHDVVHQIGGQQDSNANTTRRILLLVESTCVGRPDAYDRVLRALLNRYLEEDPVYVNPAGDPPKVPRFLVNDIVRYWRTMAVDYASKHRERGGEGWALRNAKLRLSRKLIYASGLLACFSCTLSPSKEMRKSLFGPEMTFEPLVNHLYRYVRSTPLEVLGAAWQAYPNAEAVRRMFDAYNEFLSILNDGAKRKHLEGLPETASKDDGLFQRVREIGHDFERSLTALFFDTPEIAELSKRYGFF